MVNKTYTSLVDKINDYLEHNEYDMVVFTKFKNNQLKNNLYLTKVDYMGMQKSNEQSIVVNMPHDYVILEKFGYALDKEGVECIESLNVDSVDICGVRADACVYAIALQLFDMGIYPNILINYVATEPHLKDSVKDMFVSQFGAVDERE